MPFRRIFWLALGAFLLLLPFGTAWNLIAQSFAPRHTILIGPRLKGFTAPPPLTFTLAALEKGDLQKALAARLNEAVPIRPILIRVNNEIRHKLFGMVDHPMVIMGHHNQLFERAYVDEYCARQESDAAAHANALIPLLKDIQHYYRSRGRKFVMVISPSKAAHMPDEVTDLVTCPSTLAARTTYIPDFVRRLRASGIEVVDTASLIHGLQSRFHMYLFPNGGVHWNAIGNAEATLAIIAHLNGESGGTPIPPFTYTYKMSGLVSGQDRDLADLVNTLFPPLAAPAPKVTITPGAPCPPAQDTPDVAIVGSSFMHSVANTLIQSACLPRLNFYFYFKLGRFGGTPYRPFKRHLAHDDLIAVRDADIMILEQNEQAIARQKYLPLLREILTTRE